MLLTSGCSPTRDLIRGGQVRDFRGLGVHRGPRVCSPQPWDTWGPPCLAEPPLGPWVPGSCCYEAAWEGGGAPRTLSFGHSSLASPVSRTRRSQTVLFEET